MSEPSENPGATARAGHPQPDPQWRAQELLLMREVMRLIGKSLAPEVVMREMLHLMSELLGLNRGRIVLADDAADDSRAALRGKRREAPGATARIHYAYGMTRDEIARGQYGHGEGITGRVLATGQPILVQDVHAESQFLGRSVRRDQLQRDGATFIALPIEVNHHTVGVLACHREPSRRRFNDDIALMRILATLLGQTAPDAAWLQPAPQPVLGDFALAQLPVDLLRFRPEIRQAEADVFRASGELGSAQAELYPRVALGSSLVYSYNVTQNRPLSSDYIPVIGPVVDIRYSTGPPPRRRRRPPRGARCRAAGLPAGGGRRGGRNRNGTGHAGRAARTRRAAAGRPPQPAATPARPGHAGTARPCQHAGATGGRTRRL